MNPQKKNASISGLLAGGSAFLIWGLVPIFWKALAHVPAHEIITHRVVWSLVFLVPVILFQGQWKIFIDTIRSFKLLKLLFITALLVASNCFIFGNVHLHRLIARCRMAGGVLMNLMFFC